jgi:enterochelin esterase-like enzyme
MLIVRCVAFVVSSVPGPAAAQSPPRTDTLSLHSETFHNTRLLRIWLPPGYDDPANKSERYPVMYFTDGIPRAALPDPTRSVEAAACR